MGFLYDVDAAYLVVFSVAAQVPGAAAARAVTTSG
jgi:hypothetical protein